MRHLIALRHYLDSRTLTTEDDEPTGRPLRPCQPSLCGGLFVVPMGTAHTVGRVGTPSSPLSRHRHSSLTTQNPLHQQSQCSPRWFTLRGACASSFQFSSHRGIAQSHLSHAGGSEDTHSDTAGSNGSHCRPSNGDTDAQPFCPLFGDRHGGQQALDSEGSVGDVPPSAQAR